MYIPNGLLERHVLESNLIEGITVHPGLALYNSHFQAALRVARQPRWEYFPIHPNDLHARLCRGTHMESFGGTYRKRYVWVGNRRMPRAETIPELMCWWWEYVEQFLESKESPEMLATRAVVLHYFFLCVHPYQDGNGRTARLVLNSLRLRRGLSWVIIDAALYKLYRRRIQETEAIFRSMKPDVY